MDQSRISELCSNLYWQLLSVSYQHKHLPAEVIREAGRALFETKLLFSLIGTLICCRFRLNGFLSERENHTDAVSHRKTEQSAVTLWNQTIILQLHVFSLCMDALNVRCIDFIKVKTSEDENCGQSLPDARLNPAESVIALVVHYMFLVSACFREPVSHSGYD